jgi:hypothetical protein
LLVETKNLLPVPVKSKKDKMVDELMSKLSGYDSGFARITIEQLYDLNLLKEID